MSLVEAAQRATAFIQRVAEEERDTDVKALFLHAQELYQNKFVISFLPPPPIPADLAASPLFHRCSLI
jgi:hypothetical protein